MCSWYESCAKQWNTLHLFFSAYFSTKKTFFRKLFLSVSLSSTDSCCASLVRLSAYLPSLSLRLHAGQHTIMILGYITFSQPCSILTILSALAPGCPRFQYLSLFVLCC